MNTLKYLKLFRAKVPFHAKVTTRAKVMLCFSDTSQIKILEIKIVIKHN